MDDSYLLQSLMENASIEGCAAERKRCWAVIPGLIPYQDGDQWCVLWGLNLQVGICAFGDTPEAAIFAFDKAMNEKARVPA